MVQQYKVIGTESGKILFSGRQSECMRMVNEKARKRSTVTPHIEALMILPIEKEYIPVVDGYAEFLAIGLKKRGAYKRKAGYTKEWN